MPDLRDLFERPELALELERAEAASLLARAEGLAAVLRARLAASAEPHRNGRHEPGDDRLLDAQQVGEALGLSPRQVYRRAHAWPFVRRLGLRTLKFSEAGMHMWLAAQGRSCGRATS